MDVKGDLNGAVFRQRRNGRYESDSFRAELSSTRRGAGVDTSFMLIQVFPRVPPE
jgi:hypothetical protein